MKDQALSTQDPPLSFLDAIDSRKSHHNLPPAALIEHALNRKEGKLTSTGAFMVDTGEFTGRSPKDRYIVSDHVTGDTVWWGDINIPFEPEKFDRLLKRLTESLRESELFIRDVYAGSDPRYSLKIRVINTCAWHNLFCHNIFLRLSPDELASFEHDFTIICAPEFKADPGLDGTKNPNFTIINFSRRIILIGGTGYAGEIKKGIFSVLNFLLPHQEKVLSMHCSANVGKDGKTAVFFGLSGTGKTTLSADPARNLVGDDEHGWSDSGIFNFEGGCYAKVTGLEQEKEPQIFDAIRFGSILENTRFKPGTRQVDFENNSVTENTRTAYPIHFIANAADPSVAGIPKNIFFLTADAFGVIPPISRLTRNQAMYHFISGYTAKVAGTEMGIIEPKLTFSACFGAAFLPLHPTKYAELLGEKMEKYNTQVWLVNTGWTGGPYGVGSRIKLKYTRAMISAVLEDKLVDTRFIKNKTFGFEVPQVCPSVPTEILDPRTTWADANSYDNQEQALAKAFQKNFEVFKADASQDILMGGPIL